MSMIPTPELEIVPVMIGTAGHVDHGKTALVKLLTGCDTDSLPEEKKRGMSIDLGFAPFILEGPRMAGIIDVPGHEDFIRNMVAGASSIDVLILIIAADDGIMPQTIEHLKIVSLLGSPKVMAVITKIDLVNPSRQKEIKETVHAFLAQNGFIDAPVILGSNKTGEGLEEVRRTINQLVGRVQHSSIQNQAFRMHIERTFSPPGVGTVVTGIPSSGSSVVGDKLELFPGARRTVCRAVEKYGHESRGAQAHTCCAITIKDVKASDIERGMTLALPGVYREVSSAIVSVHNVHESVVIKRRSEMRFCCGTFTRVVRGLLISANSLGPGKKGFMQIESTVPMVVAAGDRFLLRSLSPSATIAGGSVLTTYVDPRRKKIYLTDDRLHKAQKAIEDNDPFLSELTVGALAVIREAELPYLVQSSPEEIKKSVDEKVGLGVLTPLGSGHWVIIERIGELEKKLAQALGIYHQENKTSSGMPSTKACKVLGLDDGCLEGLKKIFSNSRLITVKNNSFSLAGFSPELNNKQRALKESVMSHVLGAENCIIASANVQSQLNVTDQEMQFLVRLLSEEGIITVVDHYLVATSAIQKILKELQQLFLEKKAIELAEFRQVTGLSRNLAVSVLEFFDARGITCREGKGRKLLKHSGAI